MTPVVLEELRIRSGWPSMGREVTPKTMPAETGIVDRTVSFTKGCYVGQELVARVDSRGGNVPRHLRVLTIEADTVPADGAAVMVDGTDVGVVTSSVAAAEGGVVALGYIHRSVDVPADVVIRGDAGDIHGAVGPTPSPRGTH